ncbi:NRDE protein-domain-containing protein [Naematelia encephala]|uniref:NRDE protein-domain-containing protein n=1 Tax=Naematelia encephala TaxID=71784 RepID=A0A1Y2AN15_9TREE|nr:NRDE protein-domain-containing protein [Naematelia encephala]
MCIVFYTISQAGYQLILASNRDEYLDRPALPAAWHSFEPLNRPNIDSNQVGNDHWVLSGRDLASSQGGTWLGMTRDLRIAVITNIRQPVHAPLPNPPSRGQLLKDFLAPKPPSSSSTPPSTSSSLPSVHESSSSLPSVHESSSSLPSVHEYLSTHQSSADKYEGFNLLLFKLSTTDQGKWIQPEIGYLSNRPETTLVDINSPTTTTTITDTSIHGLSNSPLATPWPKVVEGEQRMKVALNEWTRSNQGENELLKRMLGILQQTKPLESLADTTTCTCLQPLLVGQDPDNPLKNNTQGRWYGTRVSTVILVRDDGQVTFVERDISVLGPDGSAVKGTDERKFTFNALQK